MKAPPKTAAPAARDQDASATDQTLYDLVERITDQLQRGEPVDLDEYTNDHPQYADQLAKLLPALQAVEQISHTDSARRGSPDPDGSSNSAFRNPGYPLGAAIETLYSAGLRVSELVGLNDGDVDLAEGIVRVRGKGRRERLAPVGSFAARALEAWRSIRQLHPKEATGRNAPVFTNRFGRRLTTRPVGRMLEKYLEQTGLDQRTSPHNLRRTSWTAARTSPQRAGTSGPQEPRHDADLHAHQHGQPAGGVRKGASTGEVTGAWD